MEYYSPVFYLVAAALLVAFLALPCFRLADEPPARVKDRSKSLDGLRGLAALSVAVHHAAIHHVESLTGHWKLPPSWFFTELGHASVAIFFIITAYLFWTKALASSGRFDVPAFLIGRVFRIGPVYLVAVAIFIVANLWLAGFVYHGTMPAFLLEVAQDVSLGFFRFTTFDGHPSMILAGANWSLAYEWRFYLLLPILALAVRIPWLVLPLSIVACEILVVLLLGTGEIDFAFMLLFGGGIVWATVARRLTGKGLPRPLLSALALVQLTIVATCFESPLTSPWPPLLLIGAFACITLGGDLFGLLTLRATRRLGAISYPLYLMHGPVLAATFAIPALRDAGLWSPITHWAISIAAIGVALLAAMALHVLVEVPGMAVGRGLIGRMRSASDKTGHGTVGPAIPPSGGRQIRGAGEAGGPA